VQTTLFWLLALFDDVLLSLFDDVLLSLFDDVLLSLFVDVLFVETLLLALLEDVLLDDSSESSEHPKANSTSPINQILFMAAPFLRN
jgi:hypothetical protein